MTSMWGDQKSLSDLLDTRVDQFGGGNLMSDFMPKNELDPEASMMYGNQVPGPGPGPNMAPNMGPSMGPNLGHNMAPSMPVHNNMNMGPQLTQHSKLHQVYWSNVLYILYCSS